MTQHLRYPYNNTNNLPPMTPPPILRDFRQTPAPQEAYNQGAPIMAAPAPQPEAQRAPQAPPQQNETIYDAITRLDLQQRVQRELFRRNAGITEGDLINYELEIQRQLTNPYPDAVTRTELTSIINQVKLETAQQLIQELTAAGIIQPAPAPETPQDNARPDRRAHPAPPEMVLGCEDLAQPEDPTPQAPWSRPDDLEAGVTLSEPEERPLTAAEVAAERGALPNPRRVRRPREEN